MAKAAKRKTGFQSHPVAASRIAMIAALGRNGVIGRDNGMPWHVPTDLARFRALTMGKPLVMGRRTFESIGRPLKGRFCIVISRSPGFAPDGVDMAPTLEAALARADAIAREHGASEIMIGGGAQIYAQAMPLAGRLYLTHLEAEPEGDAFFPPIDETQWRAAASDPMPKGPKDEVGARWVMYERSATAPSRVAMGGESAVQNSPAQREHR